MPAYRSADLLDTDVPLLRARELVFSGTTCTEGDARAVVFATGMHTELGRVAALSERLQRAESPLEAQVRRVVWLIALIAVLTGVAFIPVATFAADLPFHDAVIFAVGLLVGNVPEGLLPVITLALAIGVRGLARRGAVVKRLSAVETLGSTSVICTDKTGTLTENHMRVTTLWTAAGERSCDDGSAPALGGAPTVAGEDGDVALRAMVVVMVACNNAQVSAPGAPEAEGVVGDPTEVALLEAARALGECPDPQRRARHRRRQFHFDPVVKMMSTLDERDGAVWVDAKGAPEALVPRCTTIALPDGTAAPLSAERRRSIQERVDAYACKGLRVLAVAERRLDPGRPLPTHREQAERDLALLGLVAMADPPRPEVLGAVELALTAIFIYLPPFQNLLGTAALTPGMLAFVAPYPLIVWGADELRRWLLRRRTGPGRLR